MVSDMKGPASTVWNVDARKGCWWVTRFSDRLPMTGLLVRGDGLRLMVASVERLWGSMAIVKRREMREAKSSQRQGVYTVWPRRRHSAEIRILTPMRIISNTACFPCPSSKTQIYVKDPAWGDEAESNVAAVRHQESPRSSTVDAMRPDREPTGGSCSTWVTHAATDMGVGRSTPNRSVSDRWPLRRLLVSPQIRLALSESFM